MITNFTRNLGSFATSVLDFVYPPFCAVCESRLQPTEKLVCDECWEQLPEIVMASGDEGFTGIDRLLSVWEYTETFQQIVHEMKFFRKKSLASRMAMEMSSLVSADPELSQADFLIPVPLHRIKYRERGFNQSLLLARRISAETGIPVNSNLKRVKMTRPQSKLGSEERQQNVQGAFAAPQPEQFSDKNVILVDDVVTTGSTLCACASVLRQTGAKKVFCVTAGKTL